MSKVMPQDLHTPRHDTGQAQPAPASADPGVAIIDALVAEKQAAQSEPAPSTSNDPGVAAIDQVIGNKGAN